MYLNIIRISLYDHLIAAEHFRMGLCFVVLHLHNFPVFVFTNPAKILFLGLLLAWGPHRKGLMMSYIVAATLNSMMTWDNWLVADCMEPFFCILNNIVWDTIKKTILTQSASFFRCIAENVSHYMFETLKGPSTSSNSSCLTRIHCL